jgi:hypothetical protein
MDRQLVEQVRAMQQRLDALGTEVRQLRQRAAWTGAMREAAVTPITNVTGGVDSDLASLDVSSGKWLLLGIATTQIADAGAGSDYTGAEVLSLALRFRYAGVPTSIALTLLDFHTLSPWMAARNTAGTAYWPLTVMAPFSSPEGATIHLQGSQADATGNTHNVTWRNGFLFALPM